MGINRNIVECKWKLAASVGRSIQVLIETLWNVNSVVSITENTLPSVLIETLWNVNEEFLREYVKCDLVLIETLWNVN